MSLFRTRKRSALLCSPLRSAPAPAPVPKRRRKRWKSAKTGRRRHDTPRTLPDIWFPSTANTLRLNLCLHARRASGRGAHPPYILKETCSVTRLTCCPNLKGCFFFSANVFKLPVILMDVLDGWYHKGLFSTTCLSVPRTVCFCWSSERPDQSQQLKGSSEGIQRRSKHTNGRHTQCWAKALWNFSTFWHISSTNFNGFYDGQTQSALLQRGRKRMCGFDFFCLTNKSHKREGCSFAFRILCRKIFLSNCTSKSLRSISTSFVYVGTEG